MWYVFSYFCLYNALYYINLYIIHNYGLGCILQ